jgi:hypothetical protein
VALRCMDCGAEVDPRDRGTLFEILGFWQRRNSGGLNQAFFKQETGRVLCSLCVVKRRYAGSSRQESLFG